jgi:signal transduction histidine kinase
MGEMIGNIAHQWRQPLNNLNLILSNLQDSYNYGESDSEYLHSSIGRGHLLIKQMSNTIDDFRYYLNPKNKKENFYILDSIKLVLSILEENIRFNNITLIVDEIDLLTAYGYKNQYSQVIYNILNNSIDALVSIKREEKIIKILIYDENDRAVCEIIDNAGGISDEIKENIFDAYFTTKNNSDGTGLGLYMAKTIINNMNGFIQWSNIKDGVSMKLVVPKGRLENGEYAKP